jgi:hypothetical protein
MIYHSVAEIFDSIDETRARLKERLAGLNTAQENFRPSSGGWSIAEIVEHLAILEGRLLSMMTVMVNKAEKSGLQRSAEDSQFNPVSLEQVFERSCQEKYIAPEAVQPQGGVAITDSLERLQQSRASLRASQTRFESTDLTAARYPHPAFGPLDLYQWLVMIGIHEERHLRQIEALMALPEYQSVAAGA